MKNKWLQSEKYGIIEKKKKLNNKKAVAIPESVGAESGYAGETTTIHRRVNSIATLLHYSIIDLI